MRRRWNLDPVVKEWESRYAGLNNNPVWKKDHNGDDPSTHINDKNEVVKVYLDGDNGVYKHEENADGSSITEYQLDKRYQKNKYSANGKKIGETISQYSFVGDDDKTTIKGAVIDMNDMSGQNFINNNFINKRPFLLPSMAKLLPWQPYDFKRLGATEETITTQYMYRGMPFNGKIASARDIGNISAGLVAGWHGFTFEQAKPFFEILQGGREPKVTTEAEKYGIKLGLQYYRNLETTIRELEIIRDSHKQPGDW